MSSGKLLSYCQVILLHDDLQVLLEKEDASLDQMQVMPNHDNELIPLLSILISKPMLCRSKCFFKPVLNKIFCAFSE